MENFMEQIKNVLNFGDEEIRTWFLIRNDYLPFILCGSYMLFILRVGPALMRNRKPFELRTVMILFNFFLVATYTVSLLALSWYLPEIPKEQFCKGVKVTKGDVTYTLASIAWVIYMLKYIEFLDTVFFILRKKENQITFLHLFHHTAVPILCWIGFRTEKSGMQTIPGIINAIVHVIMYTYYGLAAMGPEIRKHLWWKKYLTQIQMVQFLLIMLFVAVVTPLSGCTMVLSSYVMDIVVAPILLYLFYGFYTKSFQSKRQSLEIKENIKYNLLKNGANEKDINTSEHDEKQTLINSVSEKRE